MSPSFLAIAHCVESNRISSKFGYFFTNEIFFNVSKFLVSRQKRLYQDIGLWIIVNVTLTKVGYFNIDSEKPVLKPL